MAINTLAYFLPVQFLCAKYSLQMLSLKNWGKIPIVRWQ